MNISRIPFSEMFEIAQNELVRDKSTDPATENKYKGAINEAYIEDLMLMFHEDYLRTESYVSTVADYGTGYITAISTTAVTGDGDCDWTSAIANNMLLKVAGYDEVYRVTYSSAVALTLDRTWVGTAIVATNTSYRLVQDRYALASDFNHMVIDDKDIPEAVYYWRSGSKAFLTPMDGGEYDRNWSHTYGTPGEYAVKYVSGAPYLYLNPADTSARSIYYNYIPALVPMTEYTTGYISAITNGSVDVTGSGSDWDGNIATSTYDYYLRVDADGVGSASQWYKVLSATTNTAIALSSAYLGTSISSGTSTDTYTISRVSRWPAKFDHLMIYLAAVRLDPNNQDAKKWSDIATSKMQGLKGRDGRAIYGQHGAFLRDRRYA